MTEYGCKRGVRRRKREEKRECVRKRDGGTEKRWIQDEAIERVDKQAAIRASQVWTVRGRESKEESKREGRTRKGAEGERGNGQILKNLLSLSSPRFSLCGSLSALFCCRKPCDTVW